MLDRFLQTVEGKDNILITILLKKSLEVGSLLGGLRGLKNNLEHYLKS